MGIETTTNTEATPRANHARGRRPAHKKTSYAKVAVIAVAIAISATAVTAYAVPYNPETQSAPEQVPAIAAQPATQAATETADDDGDDAEGYTGNYGYGYGYGYADNTASQTQGRIWHPAWTETIVHPAEYGESDTVTMYVCPYCGYETIDENLMMNHHHEASEEDICDDYVTITRGGYAMEISPEWTETIEHPGYWE